LSAPAPISERLGCSHCGAVFRQDFGHCPLDHTPLAPLEHDPLIGTTLADRYLIERCVGEGGMGRVYRARHCKLDRLFAIKVLYGDLAASAKMRSRFEREARTASQLDHSRLVSVIDFDITEGGLLYLAMSYVEGRELAAVIEDEAPLELGRIHRLLRQLCEGLGYAHDQGMVHRDFKGQNVLVSGTGANEHVHILDFGLAFMREGPESVRLTTQGVVMGTPAYMSPEQAMNQPLDHRTDLFSLGVLLYELLAGTLPFRGTPVEVARQNMAADPPPISRRVPGLVVDAALESIAFRLMEKLPQDRFQSAHEVIAALDALSTSGGLTRSVPMSALSPLNAVDTAGITQDIHVIINNALDPLGSNGTDQTAPLPSMAFAPVEALAGEAPVDARVALAAAPAKTGEPKGEDVVTERVRPGRFASRALGAGAIVAALVALLIWNIRRGPDAPRAAPAAARIAASGATAPAAEAAPSATEPAVEAAPSVVAPAAEVAVPSLDEPAVMAGPESAGSAALTAGAVPAAREQRTRTRPAGAASTAAPGATQGRDPKATAPARTPAGEADERLETPPDEAEGPDLVSLYESVGQKLAQFEGARGRDAAASLWALYRTIPLADALRTPSLGQEAIRKLRQIERDLKRARSRPQ
jgi:serine/threonine protein kinase